MFCTKCGLKNDDDSLFCAGCGAPLKKPQYTQNMNYESNVSNAGVEGNDSDNTAGESDVSDENNVSDGNMTADESVAYNEGADVQQNDIPSEPFTQVNGDIQGNKADSIVEESIKSIREEVNQIEGEDRSVQPQNSDAGQIFMQPQNNDAGQGYIQPQMNNVNQGFAQPSGFNNTQQYGGQQNMNAQNSNFGQQFSAFPNDMPSNYGAGVQKNKFSFKRFFFSMIVILASVVACAGIAFNYVGISASYKDNRSKQKENNKGYEIIKEKVEDNNLYEIEGDTDDEDIKELVDSANLFRIMVIVFECAMIAVVIIDFILLVAVRRKGAYIFTLLFSLIKMGLGGYVIYLWCFDVLEKCQKVPGFMATVEGDLLTATPEIGLILAVGLQILVFICSIVLLTCKNRNKLA